MSVLEKLVEHLDAMAQKAEHADDGSSWAIGYQQAFEETKAWAQENLISGWQPIETAPLHEVVLTLHKQDLYPVPAYKMTDGKWRREMEGPEDLDQPQPGRYEELYRAPTHWMPLPEPPSA